MILLAWLLAPVIAWAALANVVRCWRVPVLLALLACGSCIPLGRTDHLDMLAKQEWARVGPPARFADPAPIAASVCVGSPGFLGTTAYVPWPWNEWPAASRVILRYELAKASFQAHAWGHWYWPLAFLDGALHGPVSEPYSWWRTFVDAAETER